MTAKKEVAVKALSFDCPTCGVKANTRCVKIGTATHTDPHAARVRVALHWNPIDVPAAVPNPKLDQLEAEAALPVTKAKRSHKSKAERRRKSGLRIFGEGFVERSRNPKMIGKSVKSATIRVDADFAQFIRRRAMESGVSITDVTRMIYLDLSETEDSNDSQRTKESS